MRTVLRLRPVALVATLAMTTAGLMGFATSANAQTTSLKFNCSASILSNQEFVLDAEISAPDTVDVGDTVAATFSGTVTVSETVRSAAYSLLQGRALAGTATIDAKFGGRAITLAGDVPHAPIPSSGPGIVLPASGGGDWIADTVGVQTVTIDGFVADLVMTRSDGSAQALQAVCTAKAPGTVVGTVNVVEADLDPEPTGEPEPTQQPDPTPTADPEPTQTVDPQPTPTKDPKPTTPPVAKPSPIKAVVSIIVTAVKRLVCKIIKC